MEKRRFRFAIISLTMLSAIMIFSTVAITYAAPPKSGSWIFVRGISPTQMDSSVSLTVGTVDSAGNLVNWKIGNIDLQGTYNSVTGKVTFILQSIPVYKSTYTGFHYKTTTCLPNVPCGNFMAGTWTSTTIPPKSQGWFAYLYAAE